MLREQDGFGLRCPRPTRPQSGGELGVARREILERSKRKPPQLREDHDLAREPALDQRPQSVGGGFDSADCGHRASRYELAGESLTNDKRLVRYPRTGRAGVLRAIEIDARG